MSDSSAAIAIADKPGMKDKTKHIALRYFQVRGLQKTGVVKIAKISTDFNPADIGTKALGPITFLRHLRTVVQPSPKSGATLPSITKVNDENKKPNISAALARCGNLGSRLVVASWESAR